MTREVRNGVVKKAAVVLATVALVGALLAIAVLAARRGGIWSELPAALDAARAWSASPLAPLATLACFMLGALVVFPVNLLIAATVVVFGPVAGTIWSLAGSLASAAVSQALGRRLPPRAIARIMTARAERVRHRIARHGVIAVAAMRLVPVAPYSVVGIVAGAARIPRAAYFAGTALGMLPGILLYALFVDRAREAIADPRPVTWAALAFALALIVAMALVVMRFRAPVEDAQDGNAR